PFRSITLNIVRALRIINDCSILVLAPSRAVNAFTDGHFNETAFDAGNSDYIPNSTVPNQTGGAFWAVLNRIFIIFQTIVLVLFEIGWPATFFDRFFPVLGKDFGVGALGVMQCLIGASVLSHYVGEFPLVTAFFLFSVGCLNMLVGLIFREKAKDKRSILSWRERGKDVLPSHVRGVDVRPVTADDPTCTLSDASSRSGMGFGRQGEKSAALKGMYAPTARFLLTKPVESLPKHAA
ncbi:hypothetical protein OG21DRAFT_1517476, partial [Imleria badia]